MSDTDTIIDRLNHLSADTSGDWWGAIADEFDIDDDALDRVDDGRNQTIALTDGRWFYHDQQAGTWRETDAPDED